MTHASSPEPSAATADRPPDVDRLLGRLTLDEKIGQMRHRTAGVPRLGLPAYNWWNEALHGIARAGTATVFPQSIGLAAMFDPDRLARVADVIAHEGRVKHHVALERGDRDYYVGLTYWSPNLNIYRDPRWGRGHETFGECPWLTATLGVAFIRALQREVDGTRLAAACAKHFAVHSGPEGLRHEFDAQVSDKDLHETYLPAFRAAVVEGEVASIMGAYNCINGQPACAHRELMQLIREGWGFDGYFVSDCWAIRDFHLHHKVTATVTESAALAVKLGCDLNCGDVYLHLREAVNQGLLDEPAVDRCVRRLLETRRSLGLLQEQTTVPAGLDVSLDRLDHEDHAAVALDAACASIVLLKNDGDLLPLGNDQLESVAVIGPNADDPECLYGNYAGHASRLTTPLQAIRQRVASAGGQLRFARGCTRTDRYDPDDCNRKVWLFEAAAMARASDIAIVCLGLDALIEGEQGDEGNADAGGDRLRLELPGEQLALLETVLDTGTPTVAVLIHGGPVSLGGLEDRCHAIIDAFYGGQAAGEAIARVLTGDTNPAGRLPMTYPAATEDLPPIGDYRIADGSRTYRYPGKPPRFPFGYGLSYTRFGYDRLTVTPDPGLGTDPDAGVSVSVSVTNVGDRAGDEVVQLYLQTPDVPGGRPVHDLRGVQRLALDPQETRQITFTLTPRDLSTVGDDGQRRLLPGTHRLFAGGQQPDKLSARLTGNTCLTTDLKVVVTDEPMLLQP